MSCNNDAKFTMDSYGDPENASVIAIYRYYFISFPLMAILRAIGMSAGRTATVRFRTVSGWQTLFRKWRKLGTVLDLEEIGDGA
jgi:hypothetical protein